VRWVRAGSAAAASPGGARLLGVELVFFGDGDADLLSIERRQELLLVGKVAVGG